MQRFRGGLVFKAHRLVYHSTLGLIVIQKAEAQDRKQEVDSSDDESDDEELEEDEDDTVPVSPGLFYSKFLSCL